MLAQRRFLLHQTPSVADIALLPDQRLLPLPVPE